MAFSKKKDDVKRLNRLKVLKQIEAAETQTHEAEIIVDEAAYKKYVIFQKTTTYKEKIIEASEGTKVNFDWLPFMFKKKISHLPADERAELNIRYKKREELRGKMSALKKMAYGTNVSNSLASELKGIRSLDDKKEELIELYGRMFSPQEVHKVAVEEYGINCNLAAVTEFRRKHINVVTDRIEKFKKDFSDIRLSHKKGRLEELVWLFKRAKQRFEITNASSDRDFMLKVLEQVRKETEGDTLRIEGNLDINIESTVNLHLKKEVLNDIQLEKIILGAVGSAMGMDVGRLIKQMMDSTYAKFNAMLNPEPDMETIDAEYEEMSYPSTRSYDFDEIRKKQKLIAETAKQEEAQIKGRDGKIRSEGEALGIKQRLLKIVRDKQKEIHSRSTDVHQSYLEKEVADAEKTVKKK